jgi:hypothetical protein
MCGNDQVMEHQVQGCYPVAVPQAQLVLVGFEQAAWVDYGWHHHICNGQGEPDIGTNCHLLPCSSSVVNAQEGGLSSG